MGYEMRRYKIGKWIFLAGLVLAHACPMPARAEAVLAPFNVKARYELSWNGLTVGRLIVTASEDANHYDMMLDSKTHGIGALISDDKTVTRTNGIKNAAGDYLILHYEFRPIGKDEDDYITLDYDAKGKIMKRVRTKDDDPTWRPPVPNEQIDTAHDPLTVIFILRRLLYAAMASNQHEISTRSYDGMRLFEMKLVRDGVKRLEVEGKKIEVIDVVVQRVPVNGYTPKEIKKYKKGDPDIHFYFSNDAAFIPVRATADTGFGDLVLELDKRE